MITDRDRTILEFLRKYKFITLEQLQKLFFRDSKQGYNIARRRMKVLLDLGYVCSSKSKFNKKNIYRINDPSSKVRAPEEIDIILLNILTELIYLGFEVQTFDIKTEIKKGFGNCFARVKKEDTVFNVVIDVQLTNLNHNLELFNQKEIIKNIEDGSKNIILIVSDKIYYDLEDVGNFKVKQISTKLIGLKEAIIS